MNKYTFMGNGRNKDFYFTFSFFSKGDIVVKINGTVATGYGVFCIPGTTNNDFPFTGGHIHFATAPKSTDIITIERKLQLNRIIDYQPTAELTPTIVNQDMNYFFELLKDIKSSLIGFEETYAEFTDTESANDLKERITAVTEQIDDFAEQIETIGDITTIQTSINSLSQSVSDLTSTIATHTTNIGTNTNDITTLKGYDYVIESQTPTAENNYTWYRKYKSGRVDMGGHYTGNETTVNLPVELANTDYDVLFTKNSSPSYWATTHLSVGTLNTTSFTIIKYGDNASIRIAWLIINAEAL